jgi:ABC transport system ATP-binding/permease protein
MLEPLVSVLKLIIEDDEGRKTVVPFVRDEITIGRQEGNTIRLTERNVSRRHAKLVRASSRVSIVDLGSSNGTKVNGDKIDGQAVLGDGDLVQIGDYDLAIEREEDVQAQAAPTVALPGNKPSGGFRAAAADNSLTVPSLPVVSAPTELLPDMSAEHARKTEAVPVPAGSDPRTLSTAVIRVDDVQETRRRSVTSLSPSEAAKLVVLTTEFAGKEFDCVRSEQKIGRTDDNDFVLDHRSLSRTHCKIVREDSGEWRVIDLQSANGLQVNGESYGQVTLKHGDVIELGHVKLKFLLGGAAASQASDEAFSSPRLAAQHSQSASSDTGLAPISSPWPKRVLIAGLLLSVLAVAGYVLLAKNEGDNRLIDDSLTVSDKPKTATASEDAKAAQCISDAKGLIERLDWSQARKALNDCKVNDAVLPEAKTLIERIDGEKGLLPAFKEARAALSEGRIEAAQAALVAVKSSGLLKSNVSSLEAELNEKIQARLSGKEKPPEAATQAPARPDESAAKPDDDKSSKAETLARFVADARAANKVQNWKKAIPLAEKCLTIDPKDSRCLRIMGTAYAFKGNETRDARVFRASCGYYRLYLAQLPPGETDADVLNKIDEIEIGLTPEGLPRQACPTPKKVP